MTMELITILTFVVAFVTLIFTIFAFYHSQKKEREKQRNMLICKKAQREALENAINGANVNIIGGLMAQRNMLDAEIEELEKTL